MNAKNTLISLATITIIAIAAWTTLSFHSHEIKTSKLASLPDAYMEDVTATIMDKQGKPSLKIATPKMTHFNDNNRYELTDPELTVFRKSLQPWFVTAKYARTRQGIEHIDFWEDVTIHHAADLNNAATVIKTPKLTVHPNEQKAETEEFITLIQSNVTVNATGMIADMNNGEIKLLSNARGEYVPS